MLAIAIYVLLGFAIAAAESLRFYRRGSIDALTFFNFFYFLFFAFAPINVLIFGDSVVRQKYAYHAYGPGDELTALSLLSCYLLFLMGYLARPSAGTRVASIATDGTYSLNKVAWLSAVLFFVGVVAMSFTVFQVGGLLEVLREAVRIRSGEFSFESRFVFVRQFNSFLSSAFILYLAVYLGKKVTNARITAIDRAALILMGLAFLYYALATAGRREFVYPILIYFLISSAAGRGLGVKGLIVVLLVTGIGLASTYVAVAAFVEVDAMASLGADVLQVTYLNTVQGIADSYVHYVGMQHAEIWQFGFLKDIVELPLQLVPSRLFDFDRGRGMFGETSLFYLGQELAADRTGEEPPGLHGYLLVNFGYIGMFLFFFFIGAAYRFLQNVFTPKIREDAVAWLIYWLVFLGFLVYFREGVIALALKQHASWWLTIAALMLSRRRKSGIGVTRPQAAPQA